MVSDKRMNAFLVVIYSNTLFIKAYHWTPNKKQKKNKKTKTNKQKQQQQKANPKKQTNKSQ